MEKARLLSFIEKYHLDGKIESVCWTVKKDKLSTHFISNNRSMVGNVTLKKSGIDDVSFGIFKTSDMKKLLDILEDDISKIDFSYDEKDVENAIRFYDNKKQISCVLSPKEIIPKAPPLEAEPTEYDVKIKIDKDFIGTFIKAKNALPDVVVFSVVPSKKNYQIVIGYSNVNSNSATLDVESENFSKEFTPMNFQADIFKSILSANKNAEKTEFMISSEGLAKIEFVDGDFKSQYFLAPIDDNE